MLVVAITTKRRIAIITLIDYLARQYSTAPSVQLEIKLTTLRTTTLSCESQTFEFRHHRGARIIDSSETKKDTDQHNGQRTRYASEHNARHSWTQSPSNRIGMNREHTPTTKTKQKAWWAIIQRPLWPPTQQTIIETHHQYNERSPKRAHTPTTARIVAASTQPRRSRKCP